MITWHKSISWGRRLRLWTMRNGRMIKCEYEEVFVRKPKVPRRRRPEARGRKKKTRPGLFVVFRSASISRLLPAPCALPHTSANMATLNISKKRKFVADGVFYSELNEVSGGGISKLSCVWKDLWLTYSCVIFCFDVIQLLQRKLAEDGYAGLVVKVTSPARTEIVILATRTQEIVGEKGQRISELTSLVQNRFVLAPNVFTSLVRLWC